MTKLLMCPTPSGLLRSAVWMTILGLTVLLIGCSQSGPRKASGKLDTPGHHVLRGMDAVEKGRWNAALREFELALELNAEHGPALAGKALVQAQQSNEDGRTSEKQAELKEQARDNLEAALSAAESPRDRLAVQVTAIRVETTLKDNEEWLEESQNHAALAAEILEDHRDLQALRSEPLFFLGIAYRESLEFNPAANQFRRVLDLNLTRVREADKALEQLHRVTRARPGTRHGRTVALAQQITRADLAALLIEEFQLADLYARGVKSDASGYTSPTKNFAAGTKEEILASDIANHPLKADIEDVLQLGVRGLEANPQKLFFPNRPVTRAEYALMLEDILIKVMQDQALATQFIGEKSPWSDVRADAYYYNAARTLTSRNILSVRNRIRGEFGPEDAISGADALLSLRMLKDELKGYVRTNG